MTAKDATVHVGIMKSIKSLFIKAVHVLFFLFDSDRPLATQIILRLPMVQRCKQVLLQA